MELEMLHVIGQLHHAVLDPIMVLFSRLGNAGIVWIVIALVFLCIKKYRRCGIGMIFSLVLMFFLCNVTLKNLVARPRPCWVDTSVTLLIPSPKDYSFPSGHTFAAFSAAFTIFLYHRREGIAALLAAALIAFSRLYLFVHYPTDVLAGLVFGILDAILVYKLMKRYMPRGKAIP